mmetsp:Transcript_10658/g.22150  ORF Transcript_10658/g.22150 Transcript_10658/m.22150 type:complete len:98 (+) Transcript_10658:286-579(+)
MVVCMKDKHSAKWIEPRFTSLPCVRIKIYLSKMQLVVWERPSKTRASFITRPPVPCPSFPLFAVLIYEGVGAAVDLLLLGLLVLLDQILYLCFEVTV